jgi:hypothetical protein
MNVDGKDKGKFILEIINKKSPKNRAFFVEAAWIRTKRPSACKADALNQLSYASLLFPLLS